MASTLNLSLTDELRALFYSRFPEGIQRLAGGKRSATSGERVKKRIYPEGIIAPPSWHPCGMQTYGYIVYRWWRCADHRLIAVIASR